MASLTTTEMKGKKMKKELDNDSGAINDKKEANSTPKPVRKQKRKTTIKWTNDKEILMEKLYDETPNDWVQIAKHLIGGRLNINCRDHYEYNFPENLVAKTNQWTTDKYILLKEKYGEKLNNWVQMTLLSL